MCTVYFMHASGGHKRALDPLRLEFQMVVNCCVGAEENPVFFPDEPSLQPPGGSFQELVFCSTLVSRELTQVIRLASQLSP